jgi:hypothetical protein
MNKNAEVVNKIVENLFSNENESSKTKTKQCLEESIANIEMHFSNDPAKMIMFAESIAVYFQLKSQSNAGQTLASLVEIKKQAICLPKVKRAVNGFNAFNRAMKYGIYSTVFFSLIH